MLLNLSAATAAECTPLSTPLSARGCTTKKHHTGPHRSTLSKEKKRQGVKLYYERLRMRKAAENVRQSTPGEASKEQLSASLIALRQYYKSRSNREWREQDAVTLVMFVLVIMLIWGVSLSYACNVVALLGHSHSKVQQLASPWLHHRKWTWRDQKPRGAAAEKYMAEKKEKGESPVS
jgi:hypothetical protein